MKSYINCIISKFAIMVSLPADVLWGSFVTNECVTNEPKRTSAGRLDHGLINAEILWGEALRDVIKNGCVAD